MISIDFLYGFVKHGIISVLALKPKAQKIMSEACSTVFSEEMEKLYMPTNWVLKGPEKALADYMQFIKKESEETRNKIPGVLGVSYGPSKMEKFDIFGLDSLSQDAPILVFFHGGYWIEGSREASDYIANAFVDSGIITIVAGYNLAPEVTLDEIATNAKTAMSHVIGIAQARGSKGVYVMGHSAGAQIAAMIMSSDWSNVSTNAQYFRGVILVSGVYDLTPLLQTSLKSDAHLTVDQVEKNSPVNFVRKAAGNLQPCKVLIIVADHDSPAFIKQSQEYHLQLTEHNIKCEMMMVTDEDHFTVLKCLQDKNHYAAKGVINFIML